MTDKPRPLTPEQQEREREEYLRRREEREGFPGIAIVGGHVVSDRFGQLYGDGPMKDEDLPDQLKRKPPAE